MTRQMKRQLARIAAKQQAQSDRQKARADAKRDLLARQTRREKDGLYAGRGVAAAISLSRSRINERRVQKGKPFGRIIFTKEIGGREVVQHATKGWRSYAA